MVIQLGRHRYMHLPQLPVVQSPKFTKSVGIANIICQHYSACQCNHIEWLIKNKVNAIRLLEGQSIVAQMRWLYLHQGCSFLLSTDTVYNKQRNREISVAKNFSDLL